MFSGTSFGAFELDQLIGCMEVGEYEDKQILCINPKSIAAADQYLLNKFFLYSQVVFNKYINITEWMAEQIVNWMQKNNAYFKFPNKRAHIYNVRILRCTYEIYAVKMLKYKKQQNVASMLTLVACGTRGNKIF